MNYMFSKCFSLSFLQDSEKWNNSNINSTINEFNINCIPLTNKKIVFSDDLNSNSTFKQSYDYSFKILILGHYDVGKSSLLKRYIDDTFTYIHLLSK